MLSHIHIDTKHKQQVFHKRASLERALVLLSCLMSYADSYIQSQPFDIPSSIHNVLIRAVMITGDDDEQKFSIVFLGLV